MSYKYTIAYKDKLFNKMEQISEGPYTLDFTYGLDRARKKTVLKFNTIPVLQKYFFGSYEIREDLQDGAVYEYHFLPGGAVYRTVNGTGEMLYTYSDYLGSITHVTDETGNLIHEQSFGAWGRERDPDSYEYTDVQTHGRASLLNDRGYTGHEMLPQFGLINMNGRLYDPILGRMLSPDPYVQMPDYSQNFNRYSYVLNNPLKFTDPSGGKWWHWLVADVLTGGLVSATLSSSAITTYTTLSSAAVTFQTTMMALDYSTLPFRPNQDNSLENAIKTDLGLVLATFSVFTTDESASDIEKVFGFVNNISGGESIQTLLGNGYAHYQNMSGNIDEIGYFNGRTTIRVNDNSFNGFSGVSLGHFVFGEEMALNPWDTDYNVNLFAHEFGHTYQSRAAGPMYLIKYGFPSALGYQYPEGDADYRAHENFGIWPHGQTTNPTEFTSEDWFFNAFMIFLYH